MSYDSLRLERQLCISIARASRALTAAYRPYLNTIGLTYSQYSVMLVLWEHGQSSVGEIGQLLGLDSGTLSPMIRRLETAGLVKRHRSSSDERIVEVIPTEEGLALQEPAVAIQAEIALSTGLTPDRLVELREELEGVVDSANRARLAGPSRSFKNQPG